MTDKRTSIKGGRRGTMLAAAALALLAMGVPQGAHAQFSESYKFLEAVRKSDAGAIIKAVEVPGVTMINTRDRSTGETALHITIGRRDLTWTTYLLKHGARPDITDNSGRSPLMLAVEKRFQDGAQQLLAMKANPNLANDSGETPLIRAVQLRDIEMVRLLLSGGADPEKRDIIAGMSAIDYAESGARQPGMLELLQSKTSPTKRKGVQGPQL